MNIVKLLLPWGTIAMVTMVVGAFVVIVVVHFVLVPSSFWVVVAAVAVATVDVLLRTALWRQY